MQRRTFISACSLLPAAPMLVWGSEDPSARMARTGKVPRISLAAYSLRKLLSGEQPTMSLDQGFIDFAVEQGLDAIEPTSYYCPKPTTEEWLLKLKNRAFRKGLEISGSSIGNVFTHPPGVERDQQIQTTRDWIRFSSLLGAPVIRLFAGEPPAGVTPEAASQHCIECLRQCLEEAARYGIFLALENHGGIVKFPEQLLTIIKTIDSPWLGITLDTGNLYSDNPEQEIKELLPHALNVHLKYGGHYQWPTEKILALLLGQRYPGYLTIEYGGGEDPLQVVPKIIGEIRTVLAVG